MLITHSHIEVSIIVRPCLVYENFSLKVLQYPSHRILRYVHGALNVDEKKTNYIVWLEIARRTF